MPIDIVGLIAGAYSSDVREAIAKKLLGDKLERDVRDAVERWGRALPENLQSGIHVDFGARLLAFERRPGVVANVARIRLTEALRNEGLPEVDVWTDALVEAWQEVRSDLAVHERNSFLQLSVADATPYLRELANVIHQACVANESLFSLFQTYALRSLLARSEIRAPSHFSDAQRIAHEVDARILRSVRDHRHMHREELLNEYRELMDKYLLNGGWESTRFARSLSDHEWVDAMVHDLDTPSLHVRVVLDEHQVRFASGSDTLTVEGAELLWDCNCAAPLLSADGSLVAQVTRRRDCPIHSHGKLGERLASVFSKQLVEIEAEGVKVLWRNAPEFWPASIDTIHMARDIVDSGILRGAQTVLDLGCGTGFLGLTAARNGRSVRHVVFSDWLLTPLLFSSVSWWRARTESDGVTAEFRVGLETSWSYPRATRDTFDVVLCNPPYLPIPVEFSDIGLSSTVAGTDLLEHAVAEAPKLAKRVVLSFSTLASPEVDTILRRTGRKLRPLGPSRRVPFRVVQAYRNPKYLQWLLRERGLIYEPSSYYQLWHEIQTFVLE